MTILSDTTTFSLSILNPFLYRSYLYDSETGLYYLQSRYYAPEIGRFINADEPEVIWLYGSQEHHLYAYCKNDAINRVDEWGYISFSRGWVSTPIDMVCSWGAPYLAPVKALAKKFSGFALKTKLSSPLINLIKNIANIASKILNAIRNFVKKIPFVEKMEKKNKCLRHQRKNCRYGILSYV